jgi:nicotinamidase-related amidase/type 1 glutamine amidotransferase
MSASLSIAEASEPMKLTLRSRVESPQGSQRYREVERPASWRPEQSAIIVCDMWDLHHCLNASRRVAEMAPVMNRVLTQARDRGVLIVHAPSSCMEGYADHPARRRAQEVPRSKSLPPEIGQWCKQIPSEEKGLYPIDQTDGGEDDDLAEHAAWAAKLAALGRDPKAPWKSQTDKLTIDPARDIISDDGAEIWSVLEARGIDHVILMGVHLNMCVLGRPFGLRQMAKNGKDVVLLRDLTDTMYNPARAPYVNHFTGTDLMIEHVEKFVCPSITSDQLLGGTPFRFHQDRRPHAAFLISEDEYRTDRTLPAFAAAHLGRDFRVSLVFGGEGEAGKNVLVGLGALDNADVMVVSMRRRALPKDQLAAIRRFVAAGKPVVGLRTASHAFALRGGEKVAEGRAVWDNFDPEVLGGHYHNHHNEVGRVSISMPTPAAAHPILKAVDPSKLAGEGTLYKVNPLAAGTTALLIGTIPDQPAEPVAWTNLTTWGGRVFYTSLGHPDDFRQGEFNRLLRNGIYWAAGLDVPAG